MSKPLLRNPCSASWEKMKPVDGGRFCKKCCKVVVDFTNHSSEEIVDYLRRSAEPVCGFMRNETIRKKQDGGVFRSFRLTRFLAAVYLVFGTLLFSTTSCGGDMQYDPMKDSAYKAKHDQEKDSAMKADSLKNKDSAKNDSVNALGVH